MLYLSRSNVDASCSISSHGASLQHLDDCELEEHGFAATGGC